jgi:hypothetical protein
MVDRLAAARGSPPRSDGSLSRAAAALHDPTLGILLSVDEGDHQQLPLVVTVATVNDLTGSGTAPFRVAAAGPDHLRARRRVVVRALETAAWLATAATAPVGPGWAWDVAADTVVRMPAGAGAGGRSFAAGYRWAEAVGRGLLRHCARLAGDASGQRGRPVAEPLPDHARHLVEAARMLGVRLRLEDRSPPSGVPVAAVHGAGGAPVVVAALDLSDALVAALEEAIGRIQRRPAGDRLGAGGTDACCAASEPPGVASGNVPADLGDERWPGQLEWLTRCLAAQGWRVLARPLVLAPPLVDKLPALAEVTLVAM